MRQVAAYRRLVFALAFSGLTLAACSPAEDVAGDIAEDPGSATQPPGTAVPQTFAATAWRVVAEDGARYTTQLDADGTYRDLRNGDPWQTGRWAYSDGEQGRLLCFVPEAENGIQSCWTPGRMSSGKVRATSDRGTVIELERVEYAPPIDGDNDDAA
ncbi:hypothetical protein [Qipengyuania qiaonensis]|uniref:DUF995 domain-containing protein n=1 Tax=Qipengyuania qiaonensis TaxID=2867240 RepID=A0ABS7J7K7_9SPHN|nr:hypothetical protein [Qipengyuania qiaonensis]MBX7481859.1 hypothetical protein [Qipengyuania qiaonensis]